MGCPVADTPKGPTFEDAAFLETIAKGFAAVKVRPKGLSASQMTAAQAGTREFRERANRLNEIAKKIREAVAAAPVA